MTENRRKVNRDSNSLGIFSAMSCLPSRFEDALCGCGSDRAQVQGVTKNSPVRPVVPKFSHASFLQVIALSCSHMNEQTDKQLYKDN